jgi:glycogen(starch) synthase
MHICLVSYEFPPRPGGEASYTRALAEAYSRRGDEVTLIIPGSSENPAVRSDRVRVLATETGGPVREAKFLSGAERALDYLAMVRRPDVVHVTFDYPTFLFHVRRRGIPCVATVHHLQIAEAVSLAASGGGNAGLRPISLLRASILNSLEARLLRQCDAIITVSRFTASTVRRYISIDPARLRVVMNGIDPAPYQGAEAETFRLRFPMVRERVVLYVGRLTRSKGVGLLIEAFAAVTREAPDASLVIVGSGDRKFVARMVARAATLGISGSVFFTGRLDDDTLRSAYAASTVTVLPSYMEGFGLSILESMAASRPSVATRVGGVPEVLVDGETGILAPPGDVKQLAKAICSLLADPALASRMGRAGGRLAGDRFTAERMAQETMRVYEEVIGSARPLT